MRFEFLHSSPLSIGFAMLANASFGGGPALRNGVFQFIKVKEHLSRVTAFAVVCTVAERLQVFAGSPVTVLIHYLLAALLLFEGFPVAHYC